MDTIKPNFHSPQVNFYVNDVQLTAGFYALLGFKETFRTPETGAPVHIELTLENFILGIASIAAAREMHSIPADNGAPRAEIAIWTDNADEAYELLLQNGAEPLTPPHSFLANLRAAWVYDPDGNPVQVVAKL